MLRLSGCKINLGLSVIGKRVDGFHNIESVFYPVPWNDVIELIPADKNDLTNYGLSIPGNTEDNFCNKVYQLLSRDFDLKPVRWVLLKNIPTGAGLGGGSANAATALLLLNDRFNLKLTHDQLIHYASQIGSDCAFFLKNKPQFASSRGEQLEELDLSLKNYFILIVNPGIHINTAWAYHALAESKSYSQSGVVRSAINEPFSKWRELLFNDFERVVFPKHPEIALIKERMYESGAIFSNLSGSGSSVFGIFLNELNSASIKNLITEPHYLYFYSKLH